MSNNEVMMDILKRDIAEGDSATPHKGLARIGAIGYSPEDNIKKEIAATTRRYLEEK